MLILLSPVLNAGSDFGGFFAKVSVFLCRFRSLLAGGLNGIGSVDVTAAIIANLGHVQIEA